MSDLELIDDADALSTLHTGTGFFYAQEYGLLKITGKGAASFLQSQLTNDINGLPPGGGQYACLLDRKAHIESYFHLFKDVDPSCSSLFILAEKEQLPILVDRLEECRFAAEVNFVNCSDEGSFFAIQGDRANQIFGILQENIYLHKIANADICDIEYGGAQIHIFRHSITGKNGYFFWISNSDFSVVSQNIEMSCESLNFHRLDPKTLETLRIESGLLEYNIDFDKNTLLPETGLVDQTVSYNKGCFIGQEVLARVRSHGVPAKALIGLTLEAKGGQLEEFSFPINTPILVGSEEIGTIKSNTFSRRLNKLIAFTVLKRDYRVPKKEFSAHIGEHAVRATVILLPFVKVPSNTELANQLYKQAVQKYVQESDESLPVESISLLKEVLILDPQLEDAYEALSVILSKHNNIEEAILLMKYLAQLNPDAVMAHSNLSQFYILQGLKEAAEEEKAIALSIRMRLAAAQFAAASQPTEGTLKEKEDLLKRMDMFEQVLAIDKEDFFANAGFGECLVAQNAFEKAIPYLKKAIELKAIHLPAYIDLAKAYTACGNSAALAKDTLEAGIAMASKRGDMKALQQLQDELARMVQE